jgi:hypothetical protein
LQKKDERVGDERDLLKGLEMKGILLVSSGFEF